jgi:hypothetical protein
MGGLIQWGLPIVQWVQTFRSPVLDPIMGTTYYLGAEDFFILFLPLIFWCIHKSLGIRLSFAFIFSNRKINPYGLCVEWPPPTVFQVR